MCFHVPRCDPSFVFLMLSLQFVIWFVIFLPLCLCSMAHLLSFSLSRYTGRLHFLYTFPTAFPSITPTTCYCVYPPHAARTGGPSSAWPCYRNLLFPSYDTHWCPRACVQPYSYCYCKLGYHFCQLYYPLPPRPSLSSKRLLRALL